MGKGAVKHCVLGMAWPLHLGPHCDYGYLHKACVRSSQPEQPTFIPADRTNEVGYEKSKRRRHEDRRHFEEYPQEVGREC